MSVCYWLAWIVLPLYVVTKHCMHMVVVLYKYFGLHRLEKFLKMERVFKKYI